MGGVVPAAGGVTGVVDGAPTGGGLVEEPAGGVVAGGIMAGGVTGGVTGGLDGPTVLAPPV
jgi:hypothetical protein